MNTRYDISAINAREAIEELRLAAYEQGYKDAVNDLKRATPISKELTRDEVVEMAKRIIEALKRPGVIHIHGVPYPWEYRENLECQGSGIAYNTEYIVNKEKRTVVVLLRGFNAGDVIEKGIAKCDPDDCFNVHIGKAIALHRALGLEVPKEYLNAPQPTDVRVGDVVEYRWIDGSDLYTIDRDVVEKVEGSEVTYANNGGWDPLDYILNRGDAEQLVWVCDDSREGEEAE